MNSFKRLLRYCIPYKWYFVAIFLCSLVVAAGEIFPAWIVKDVVNEVLLEGNATMIGVISALIVFALFMKGLGSFAEHYLLLKVSQRIVKTIRAQAFEKISLLSLSYYEKQQTGQIMSKITSDVGVLQNLVSQLTTITGDTISLMGFLIYIFYIHWKLALICVVIIPVIGLFMNNFARKMKRIGASMQDKIGNIATTLQEFITGVKVVKSFTLEEYFADRFEEANEGNYRETMRGGKITAAINPIIEFVNACSLAVIFAYGGSEVIKGNINPGQLISFLVALTGLFHPIRKLSRISNVIAQSVGAGERVFELLDTPSLIQESPDAKKLENCKGKVEYKNVVFRYEEDTDLVLNKVSIRVEPGEIIALVGPSGSGKTTFVNLLPRFYDVTSGGIFIDGKNIKDLTLNSLRSSIGVVPQDTFLFSGTIEENIRLGRLDATFEEIVQAAKMANADTFIREQPNGYETLLGERGVNLSGGQGQRIALARAFLKDPPILILDEATSALDSETENLIKDSLKLLMKGRTTFMIAHRLSTVVGADKIIVLDKGRMVEVGKHEDLIALKGAYYNLYYSQYKSVDYKDD